MTRRLMAALLGTLLLGVCLALAGRLSQANPATMQAEKPVPADDFPHFVVQPYLQNTTPSAVTILWETSFPGTSTVRFGVHSLSESREGDDNATLHEVKLSDLKPNTAYIYQVTTVGPAGKLESPLLTFGTSVGTDDAFSFALFGDTQKNPRVTEKIAALAWQRRPNFVLHLGDVVDNGPDKREWVNELLGPCSMLFSRVPVFPCIGNHEKNHANYYRYFSLPAPEYHYHFRYGNADFFSIDTNRNVGPGSPQYRWLDVELARSNATWKFCYHHHPAYSSDNDDYGDTFKGKPSKHGDSNARQLVSLYEKHNVDIVFSGHVHVYERTFPIRAGKVNGSNGIVYMTSGGGGGRLEDFTPVPTWFKAQTRSDYHFGYVTILGNRLSFRAFDHQGMLFDTFDLEKK